MASTATNKQPLLIDRVFNTLEILTTNTTGNTSAPQSDQGGTNPVSYTHLTLPTIYSL